MKSPSAEKMFISWIFLKSLFYSWVRTHTKGLCLFVWFDSLRPLNNLSVMRDGSSWVEPVLSKDKCVLLKDHNPVTPVRLDPAALRSLVKHSTTEPLCSHTKGLKFQWYWRYEFLRPLFRWSTFRSVKGNVQLFLFGHIHISCCQKCPI